MPALPGLACGRSGTSLSLFSEGDAIHVGSSDAPILSALYAGRVVADRLSIAAGRGMERHLRLDDTDQPLLIVGAIAAAGIDAARIAVSWPLRSGRRVALELNPDTATVVGLGSEDIGSPEPARIDIVLNDDASPTPPAHSATRKLADGRARAVREGVEVDEAARSTVLAFFDKCLVPTTARSRDAGAGAGFTDND